MSAPLACISCGYNLHGLPAESRCPECGLDLAIVKEAPALYHASRPWLTAIALGGIMLVLLPLPRAGLIAAILLEEWAVAFKPLVALNGFWTCTMAVLLIRDTPARGVPRLPQLSRDYFGTLVCVGFTQFLWGTYTWESTADPAWLVALMSVGALLADALLVTAPLDRLGPCMPAAEWLPEARRVAQAQLARACRFRRSLLHHILAVVWVGLGISVIVQVLGGGCSPYLLFMLAALSVVIVGGNWWLGLGFVMRAVGTVWEVRQRKSDPPWLRSRWTESQGECVREQQRAKTAAAHLDTPSGDAP